MSLNLVCGGGKPLKFLSSRVMQSALHFKELNWADCAGWRGGRGEGGVSGC